MPIEVPATPLEVLVDTRPSPEVLDTLAYQIVDVHQADYQARPYGTSNPESATDGYDGFKMVKEESISHDKTRQWWYSGPSNQDTYNYSKDYVFDSSSHPLFQRRYITRRDLYTELTRGSGGTLTGVWMIKVDNPGSGYDAKNPPAVTVAAGAGNTATAAALVNPDGTLGWIYITSEGDGYVAVPAVTVAPPTAGVQATATAVIQSTSCVLVSQKIQDLGDDPRASLYVLEIRLYQTFPGPTLTEWRWVPRIGKYAKIEKQLVLNSTVPADNNTPAPTAGITVEYQPINAVYSVKMTTTLPTDGFAWDGTDANDYVYEGTMDYRWPDQITAKPQINMIVAALSNGAADWDFALDDNLKEGYAGPCRAIIRERYTYDPTDASFIAGLPSPTLVIPQAQALRTGVVYYTSNSVRAGYITWEIPMSLHPQFTYVDGDIIVNGQPLSGGPGSTAFSLTPVIFATTPTGFSTGDSILRVTKPERVGIGDLWSVLIIEIFHP